MKNRLAVCAFVFGAFAVCAASAYADDAVTDTVQGTADAVYKAPGQVVDAVYPVPGQVVDATYKAPGQVVDAVGSVVSNFVPKNKKS